MDRRIKIYKTENIVVNGRNKGQEALYYSCWASPKKISDEVFYSAENMGYGVIAEYKIRYCKKLNDMLKDLTKFILIDGSNRYLISDMSNSFDKDYIIVKGKSVQH